MLCICPLCDHLSKQHIEHFHHPRKVPCPFFQRFLSTTIFGILLRDTRVGLPLLCCSMGDIFPLTAVWKAWDRVLGSGRSRAGLPWDASPSGSSTPHTKSARSCWWILSHLEMLSACPWGRACHSWNPLQLGPSESSVL